MQAQALTLRTKLYQNSFFFTGHQNVNKPSSRAARTVYEPIFLRFYKIIASFLLRRDANKTKSNCYNRLKFVKKTQINTVENTERRTKLRR